MLRTRLLAVTTFLLAGVLLALACGTSSRPPPAEESFGSSSGNTSGAGQDGQAAFGDAGTLSNGDPYFNCEPADAAVGECPCHYRYGTNAVIDLPCGITLCSAGKMESAHCTATGQLVIVPGYVEPYCEAGLPGDTVRPCDAGTLPIVPH